MRRIAVLLTSVGLSFLSVAGIAHADDAYPPKDDGTASEAPLPVTPQVSPDQGALPVTGSNSSSTLQIGLIAVAAGGGLVAVAGSRRRRPSRAAA